MYCVSAHSTSASNSAAIAEILDRLTDALAGETADLIVAFASPQLAGCLGTLADECAARSLTRHVLGCTGESILAGGREYEGTPALAVLAIRLTAGGRLRPIRLTLDDKEFAGWPDDLFRVASPGGVLILLADPFSFPADRWLRWQSETLTGLRVVGGMASGGMRPGSNRLVLDGDVYEQGAIGMLIEEEPELRTLVSQGCRPIGQPYVVTGAVENLIKELGRRPTLDVLRELYESLEPRERELVQGGLHLGRVINEYQEAFGRGDFLVRNVLGVDDEGGLAITDNVRVGQTVQFHVRDAETASEDLRLLLASSSREERASGALVFSCNGRGSRLFSTPDHDATAIRKAYGPIPTAGFFAMGEIGPVGVHNFLHGFTASIALLGRGSEQPR